MLNLGTIFRGEPFKIIVPNKFRSIDTVINGVGADSEWLFQSVYAVQGY